MENVEILIVLPLTADRIVIDGVEYLHAHRYQLDARKASACEDIIKFANAAYRRSLN
jgi:hypothetical protein